LVAILLGRVTHLKRWKSAERTTKSLSKHERSTVPTTPESIESNLHNMLMRHLDDFSLAEKDIITSWVKLVVMRREMKSPEFAAEVEYIRRSNVR